MEGKTSIKGANFEANDEKWVQKVRLIEENRYTLDDILIIYDKSWGNISIAGLGDTDYSHFIATKLTSDIEPFYHFFVLYEGRWTKIVYLPKIYHK